MNHLVPVYTFPKNVPGIENGSRFMARPLNHWRKQYQSNSNIGSNRRTAVGMPMDIPGGMIPVASALIQCSTCNGAINLEQKIKNLKENITICICKIKPLTNTTPFFLEKTFIENQAYMQARFKTYAQNAEEPTLNELTSTQTVLCNGIPTAPNTTYKPNNVQYAQQGAVSSGSRLARLKYNTLNNNGAEYLSASGALGVNSGRYITEPSPSYYNKYKPQQATCVRKAGAKTYCQTYSVSLNES